MEQLIEDLPNKKPISEVIPKYYFAQPERVFINSINDTDFVKSSSSIDEEAYSAIRVKFPRPILNLRTIELISAQIPIPTTNIPDTETTFFTTEWDMTESITLHHL